MRINVGPIQKLRGDSLQVVLLEKCPPLSASGQPVTTLGPVTLQVTVTNTGDGMLVRGEVQAEVEIPCSRCLEPFSFRIERGFEEEFRRKLPAAGGSQPPREETWEPQDGKTSSFSGEVIDLGPLVSEVLQVALPMKNLCSPSCKGICPGCGTNLNQGDCNCLNETRDPRLSVLSRFLRDSCEEAGDAGDEG